MSSVISAFKAGLPILIFSSAVAAEVRVVGTDLLGLGFSQAVYAFAAERAFPVALALDGSRPGLVALEAGRADVALLTLPDDETTLPPGFASFPVAYHRAVVLVPATCPLPQVTLEQLAGAFGERLERWGDLGVEGAWAGAGIAPLAPEDGHDLALELFRRTVLHDRELQPRVARYRDTAALRDRFRGVSRVLALASAVPPDAAVKAVPIAIDAREPAFLPTPENVHSGDYPLRLPVRLVFRREAVATLRPLLRFLAGDAAATHFERAGAMPLPASLRAQQLARLEKM